jgi:YHS domain-containing protein
MAVSISPDILRGPDNAFSVRRCSILRRHLAFCRKTNSFVQKGLFRRMAKKQIVQFIDDIDGKVLEEFETVRWSLDGKQYEFDTSPKHAQQFRDSLTKYVEASRAVTGRRGARRAAAPSGSGGTRSKEQTQAIRDWANSNGYEVSNRGRIPIEVVEAFEAAH